MILPTDIKNMIMRIMYKLMYNDVMEELQRNITIYHTNEGELHRFRPYYYPRYKILSRDSII